MEGFKDYIIRLLKQLPRKILSIIVQILLTPVSLLISAFGAIMVYGTIVVIFVIIITSPPDYYGLAILSLLFSVPGVILGHLCFCHIGNLLLKKISELKNVNYFPDTIEGTTYTYSAEVEHDIKDSYGTVIGSYTTTETKKGYSPSDEEVSAFFGRLWACTIAFPCRIVSLLLSVVSIFCTGFFVMVRTPKLNGVKYNIFLHRYFDLVIPEKK